jgi:hypothetical protein
VRTFSKSNGLATIATERTGSSLPASASEAMIPPRHQPTTCTGSPSESSLTAATAFGITSSTQCSMPSCRSLKAIAP